MLAGFASHRGKYCPLSVRRHADLTNTAGAWATAAMWNPAYGTRPAALTSMGETKDFHTGSP